MVKKGLIVIVALTVLIQHLRLQQEIRVHFGRNRISSAAKPAVRYEEKWLLSRRGNLSSERKTAKDYVLIEAEGQPAAFKID